MRSWVASHRVGLYTLGLVALNMGLLSPSPSVNHRHQPAPARAPRVGLVFDVGGRGDKSFNDAAFIGLERAQKLLGVAAEYIEPSESTDRESGIRLLAAKQFDLIIGVGFIFSDDLFTIAKEYPQTHFACIDYAKYDAHGFVAPPPNLVALKFREEEGAFVVGAMAALVSERLGATAVGFVGGMDLPLIHKFEAGYRAGVEAVCSRCRLLVGYAGTTGEAFKNPTKGKELAFAEYDAGAQVIFHAAGSTGLGVFEAARERERYAIGVDSDQWAEAPGRVLTSMTKQVDVAVFEVVRELLAGRFKGGVRVFGLKEGGVDYVYDAHNQGLIPADVRARVEALRRQIVAGTLVVPAERSRPSR